MMGERFGYFQAGLCSRPYHEPLGGLGWSLPLSCSFPIYTMKTKGVPNPLWLGP